MDEPKWLTRRLIELIHYDRIAEHGGRYGIRDPGLLDSALARPKQRWAYDRELDRPGLAAGNITEDEFAHRVRSNVVPLR